MKKIFTLAVAATAALAMSAADFTIYFKGEPVTDGASYTQGYTPKGAPEEEDGTVYQAYIQDAELFIAGEDIDVTVEVTAAEDNAAGLQLCWPSNCQMINAGKTAIANGNAGAEPCDLEIHGLPVDGIDGAAPVFDCPLTFTLVAYETEDPDSKITITMTLTTEPETGGVKSAIANTNYVKSLPGGVLSYSVAQPCTLSVYAITGNLVARYPIAQSGSVNVSNLGKGVYVYTTGRISGKFIVR